MLFETNSLSKITKYSIKKQVKVKTRNQDCDYDSQGPIESSEDATTSQKSPVTLCLRLT